MTKAVKPGAARVFIKGNKYGLVVHIDESLSFDEAKEEVITRLKECEKFYRGAALAASFTGKKLSDEEIRELVDIITGNSELRITCVIDDDKFREEYFKKTLDEKLREIEGNTGQFYKGTLRSGQILESETSIIILGDVHPGAKVIAAGNVVILGSLDGTVYAGVSGNMASFVVALEMRPVQIRIGDIIGRAPDNPVKKAAADTMIAYVEDGNIYIEPLNKEVLNDIRVC